jgi:hypothetical protein
VYSDKDGQKQRFYASLDEFTVFSIPWLCQRGLQSIKTRTAMMISRADAFNVAQVRMRMELAGLRDFRFGAAASYNPGLAEDIFEDFEWDLDFAAVDSEIVTDLNFWCQSGNFSSTAIKTLGSPSYGAGNVLTAIEVADLSANNQDPVTSNQATAWIYRDAAGDALFDTLGMRVTTAIRVRPVGGLQPSGNIQSVTARAISFMQTKGFDLAEVFDPNAWVPARTTYKAGDIVQASDDSALPIARRNLDRRRVCVWVGPTGRTVVPERGMPPNHHERFERVRGIDDTWRHWFVANINAPDPAVCEEFADYVVLFNFIPILTTGQVRSAGTLASLKALATLAEWEIRAIVEDTSGGLMTSGDLVGQSTVLMDCEHYPTDAAANAFLFLQAEANRTANAVWTLAEAFSSGSLHSFKEGRLSQADMKLVHRGRIRIPSAFYSEVSAGLGLRIRLEARIKPSSVLYQQGLAADITSKLEGALSLVCTGASIWRGKVYEREVEFQIG